MEWTQTIEAGAESCQDRFRPVVGRPNAHDASAPATGAALRGSFFLLSGNETHRGGAPATGNRLRVGEGRHVGARRQQAADGRALYSLAASVDQPHLMDA